MEKIVLLITVIFIMISLPCTAAVYYISESTGSDSNSGLSHAQAWRELDKIEDGVFNNGDVVLLKCGDTWNKTQGDWGSVGNDIDIIETNFTIGAYYLDGGTPKVVDGNTCKCSDVGANKPIINGNVSSGWGLKTFNQIFKIDGGSRQITIQDVELKNYYRGINVKQTLANKAKPISDIIIQRCKLDNFGHDWIHISPNDRGIDNISNITIQDNVAVKAMRYFAGGIGGWGNCLSVQLADNCIIRRNNFGQCNGECINFIREADDGEVYDNIVWDIDGGALKVTTSDNVSYHHNYAIHTNDGEYKNRSSAGLVISSEGDCEKRSDGCTDLYDHTDASNNRMYSNVIIGFSEGFWVNDGTDDDDVGSATNYVYNNTFIDNKNTYRLPTGGATVEFTIEFQNNLSIVNDTLNSSHFAYNSLHSSMHMNGNGWDISMAVDIDYCSNRNCDDGEDITGDPDLVDPASCNANGWWACSNWNTPDWGDAALGQNSDFIDNAQTLAAAYKMGLDKSSSWPGNSVTLDQNSYGSGWEFGAYVYTDGTPINTAPTANAGPDQTITLPSIASLDGTVTDDGLPNPPGSLTYLWTKQSGPAGGVVTFSDENAVDTTAAFSIAGTYVLRLTADDSDLQTHDDVTITVNGDTTAPDAPTGLEIVE